MNASTVPDSMTNPDPSPEYEPIMHSSGIEGFLIDVQTRVWRNIKQSGLELFIQGFDKKYYNFNIAFDPYFYVLLDEWGSRAAVIKDLIKEKSKLGNYERVKDIKIVRKHISGTFDDLFRHSKKALKVIAYYPNDIAPKKDFKTKRSIPGVREIAQSIKGVCEWREADIPFHIRAMIDLDLNIGRAYRFKIQDGAVYEYKKIDVEELPQLEACTFDIEIKKEPVKKPKIGDPINLFGYKFRDAGFMINNVGIHGVEIEDFWMGVKDGVVVPLTNEEVAAMKNPQYNPLFFNAVNVKNERDVILEWKRFLLSKRPKAIGGYYSDVFDWNQIIGNGKNYKIDFDDLFELDGFEKAYKKDGHVMIDTIKFIKRDSYLSKGNQGLKDASKIILNIEPLEIDHEETVRLLNRIQNEYTNPEHENHDMELARKEVQSLAHYCASDVFITSAFLEKHIIDLDVGLASILPMTVFETARKRRGPMVEAMLLKRFHDLNMIAPNKVKTHGKKFFNPMNIALKGKTVFQKYKVGDDELWARCVDKKWMTVHCKECGHYRDCRPMLRGNPFKSKRLTCHETKEEIYVMPDANLPVKSYGFVGGFVKAFNIGVFKDNCPIKFEIKPERLDIIEKKMKSIVLKTAGKLKDDGFTVDIKKYIKNISNGFNKIREKCTQLEDGTWEYHGLITIVHIDVSSMYPSIIINWNLQPHGVVNEHICNSCPHHHDDDEPCCWVELPWDAVYGVLMLPPELKKSIDAKTNLDDMTAEKAHDFYEDKLKEAINKKTVEKPGRRKNEYKVSMIARFCQKAHKTFVNMMDDFRKERYKYKYGEKDVGDEIESIRDSWKEQMPSEIKKRVDLCRNKIDNLQSRIGEMLAAENVDDVAFKQLINESLQFKRELKKLLSDWMGEIPGDLQRTINKLNIKKTYNRNAQLTYKVILNAIYGWLKSIGARLWSIEVTGCTTMKGQHIILWVVDYIKDFAIEIEIDSLDYKERLIFRTPSGLIKVLPIGKFVDLCFRKNGFDRIDQGRNVEYATALSGWKVLSVDDYGNISWEKIKMGIRQKTDRDILEVETPFGSAKVTSSHSIYHNNDGKIEPFEVGKMKDEKITHISLIPPVERKNQKINLLHSLKSKKFKFNVHIFIPVNEENERKWGNYPVSRLRESKYSRNRIKYYRVPPSSITEYPKEEWVVGAIRGNKFSPIINLDEDLAELAGWFVAEGSKGIWGDIGVGISQQKGKNLTKIINLAKKIGKNVRNYEPHPSLGDAKSNTYRVAMDNRQCGIPVRKSASGIRWTRCPRRSSRRLSRPSLLPASGTSFLGCSQRGIVARVLDRFRAFKASATPSGSSALSDNLFFYSVFTALGCGNNSREKRIPSTILSSENKIKKAFLRGYIGGDGFIARDGAIMCGTISDGLRDDLYVLGSQMGYAVICRNTTTPKGDPFYEIRLTTVERMEGSSNYACSECIGNTIGLKAKSVKEIKKTTGYVYDLSVDRTHKFVGASGGMVFSNTDGCWGGIPADLPLKMKIKGIDENGNERSIPINLFNSIVNRDVKDVFTNENNYVFNKETGEYECVPQCLIKFDYDGPYSTYFVYRKKRYTAKERDHDDPTRQKIAEVKGMDQKRKGELEIIKTIEREVDNAYEEATSYDEVYVGAAEAVEKFIGMIKNREMEPTMIYEARDISSVATPKNTHKIMKTLESKNLYDPMKVPMINEVIRGSSLNEKVKKKLDKTLSNKSYNSRQAVGCTRLIDLGVEVENGETVQWIITKHPEGVDAISQRAIPTLVFDTNGDQRKTFLKRWAGIDMDPGINYETAIKEILDWDYYLERVASKVTKIVLIPWTRQKHLTSKHLEKIMENIKNLLKIDEKKKKKKNKKGSSLFSFTGKKDEGTMKEKSGEIASLMNEKARESTKKKIDMKNLL